MKSRITSRRGNFGRKCLDIGKQFNVSESIEMGAGSVDMTKSSVVTPSQKEFRTKTIC